MFPRLLPITIVSVALAFGIALFATGLAPEEPQLWQAAVALVILGAITPLIYAVNVRILPVFSRRTWQSPQPLAGALVSALASGWVVFAGRAARNDQLETFGHLLALAGGLLFIGSVIRLFRSPVTTAFAPPLPYAGHEIVDRVGIRFTRFAGYYLLVGLGVGVLTAFFTPDRGRWDLVWAHALLVGWFLHMASGVCYHVLARWTGKAWKTPSLIPLHLRLTSIATPLMLVALMFDLRLLFAFGGATQAVALLLFAANVVPMVWGLPVISRVGMLGAVAFLVTGVLLGAMFAIDPDSGARLRFSHASVNLFGWTALLISGVGYYLFPRFAGQALRWPRLAMAQLGMQALGVALLAVGWGWRFYGGGPDEALIATGAAVAGLSIMLFGGIIGLTFRRTADGTVGNILIIRPPGGNSKRKSLFR